jgi:hypothetical protein
MISIVEPLIGSSLPSPDGGRDNSNRLGPELHVGSLRDHIAIRPDHDLYFGWFSIRLGGDL